jgi:hypothetical protein
MDPVFKRSPEYVYRRIGDESVLVPIGRKMHEKFGLFRLNEVASDAWDLLERPRSVDEIVGTLLERYEVDRPTLESDIGKLIDQLCEAGLAMRQKR